MPMTLDPKLTTQARILIIDDDPGILALLGEALSGQYQVRVANGAETAWRLLAKQGLPDLILLDFQMPGMSGPDFLQALQREFSERIPVIFITADQTSSTESYCLSLGASDFVAKPVHLKILLHRIEHHLSLRLLHQQLEQSNQDLQQQVQKRTLELEQRAQDLEQQIQQRTQIEARLRYQSRHDPVLALPNRYQLLDAMQQHQLQQQPFSLLLFSIEQFHEINYTLGRQIGDAILQQLCQHLCQQFTAQSGLLSLEQDHGKAQYWACIEGVNYLSLFAGDHPQLQQLSEQLQEFLTRGLSHEGRDYSFRGRLGAVVSDLNSDCLSLIEQAFVAVEQARKADEPMAWYQAQSNPYNMRRLALLAELPKAMSHNQLSLYYQPKVNLLNGSLVGMEALLRWNHPVYGAISPLDFVTLAETTGAIRDLTHWVIVRAAQDTASFRCLGIRVQVSINISAKNLCDRQLPSFLHQTLQQQGLNASDFLLEVTETAMLQDARLSQEVLLKLQQLGFQLSIDDFGTGYSSLAFLTKVAAQELKIDRSFVKDILIQSDCHNIVQATIRLAQDLGMTTVAEGIETLDIAQRLMAMGCTQGQGYYYYKPMPVEQFKAQFGATTAPDAPADPTS